MSENIPYIIAENGYYYVAYKEKAPVPEIVVSSKGVANGLSEKYNNGWDFGPDSYNPNSTANPPYTQTAGIQEAIDYVYNELENTYGKVSGDLPNVDILLMPGQIFVLSTTVHFRSTENQWINIHSTSRGASVITAIPSATFPLFQNDSGRREDLQFENLVFAPVTSSQYTLYSATTSSAFADYHFKDCFISNAGGTDIYIEYINQLEITRVFGLFRFYAGWVNDRVDITASNLLDNNIAGGGNSNQGLLNIINSSINLTGNDGFINLSSGGTGQNPIGISMKNIQITGTTPTSGYFINNSAGAVISMILENFYTIDVNSMTLTSATNIYYYRVPSKLVINGSQFISATIATPTLSANPPVSATVYQNTNPYPIEIDLPVYATTAGTAGYVTVAKGATDTPTAIANQYVSGDTSSSSVDIVRLRVPAGWYYEFTASGVTFGTASVFAD